jgi:hypothetical protein
MCANSTAHRINPSPTPNKYLRNKNNMSQRSTIPTALIIPLPLGITESALRTPTTEIKPMPCPDDTLENTITDQNTHIRQTVNNINILKSKLKFNAL